MDSSPVGGFFGSNGGSPPWLCLLHSYADRSGRGGAGNAHGGLSIPVYCPLGHVVGQPFDSFGSPGFLAAAKWLANEGVTTGFKFRRMFQVRPSPEFPPICS